MAEPEQTLKSEERVQRRHRRRRELSGRRCPSCGKRTLFYSPPKDAVELLVLPLLLFRPFYCKTCKRRHYGLLFLNQVTFEAEKMRKALLILGIVLLGILALSHFLTNFVNRLPPPEDAG